MTNNIEELMERSTTVVTKAVFPGTTNHYDTLFGGTALKWMDETAFITATRFSRQRMVTVSIDRTDFKVSIEAGTIVEMIGKVVRVGKTSVQVKVEIFKEEMYSKNRVKAIDGVFTMVAVDQYKKPTRVLLEVD